MESKAGFFSWSLVNIGHVPCFNLKVSSSLRPGSREATTGRCTRGLPGQSGVEFYWSCPLDRYQPKKSTHKYKNSIWFHWLPCKELFYGHVAGNFPNNSFSLQLWWWVCRCRNTLLRYDPQHLENKKTDVYPPANDHISPVARQVQKWCSFSSGGKNVSSLEGVIGIFLMPRRFGERPQATVPSCYLDECQQLFLWKKGFRLDGFFGKGTFTQKKAICINLFIWNFKLVSLSRSA